MGPLTRRILLAAGVLAAAGAAIAADGQRSAGAPLHGDAARGQQLAVKWCASCHALGSAPLNDQAPTFAGIAKSRPEAALRGFLMQPHPPMPPLSLANQEIEDILAYLRAVKTAAK